MVQATLSIMGLYNYDNSVLNGLIQNLPTAAKIPVDDVHVAGQDLNADALITELLAQSGEMEFIYPNPDAARKIITAWALINADRWQRLYNTMWFSYNPIWNKDGTTTRTETETHDLSVTDTGTASNTGSGTETRKLKLTETTAATATDTKKVAGYNSNDFVNSEQQTSETVERMRKTIPEQLKTALVALAIAKIQKQIRERSHERIATAKQETLV